MIDNKPSLLAYVGRHVPLRRVGKEYLGRCPFHADKSPSFSVNENKGLFCCFACGESGDVIAFAMKLEGLTFPEALQALGINSKREPPPRLTAGRKRAAELALAWIAEQRGKFNIMIADDMGLRDDADELGAFDVADVVDRELVMLRGFYDSLEYSFDAAELLAMRQSIEQISDATRITL